jgi:FdhD protein
MATKADIERFDIHVYNDDGFTKASADVIKEVPLEIFLNGQKVITLACNGNHTEDLAVGFLRSEGFIRDAADLQQLEVSDERSIVSVYTKGETRLPWNEKNAGKTIASSGARSWIRDDISHSPKSLLENRICISPKIVFTLVEKLIDSSHFHKRTGGTHSSALAHGESIIIVREDIGRHNTIDMLGGYALLNEIDCSDKIIVRTGRVSLEIVNKVWNLGIPLIVSLSVPTSSAIYASMESGITLIGSVRGGKMNVYCHEWRVVI